MGDGLDEALVLPRRVAQVVGADRVQEADQELRRQEAEHPEQAAVREGRRQRDVQQPGELLQEREVGEDRRGLLGADDGDGDDRRPRAHRGLDEAAAPEAAQPVAVLVELLGALAPLGKDEDELALVVEQAVHVGRVRGDAADLGQQHREARIALEEVLDGQVERPRARVLLLDRLGDHRRVRRQRAGVVGDEQGAALYAPHLGREDVRGAEEAGGELGLRRFEHSGGAPHLLDPALVHHRDPVAHRQRLLAVVGDEDEADPELALEALELHLHLAAEVGIERRQRLVEQQHLGLQHQGAGEGHPLPLAAAELVRPAFLQAGQPHHRQRLADLPRLLSSRQTLIGQAEADVLLDGQVGEEGVLLEDHVDRPLVGGHPRHVLPLDADRPGARRLEAGDHPQQRGLAAAARPQQREQLAAADGQGDAVDRDHLAEALGDVLDLDAGWGCVGHLRRAG